jgi:hypothetical protein
MTTLQKIQFVLNNSSSASAAILINNADQMAEVQTVENRLYEGITVYTTEGHDAAMKAAMIIAINNGTI